MKKAFIFVLLSFLGFLLIGCPHKITCPQGPEGKEIILPKCEILIKYDSVNLTLPNLSIPIPAIGTTITVGSGTWKKDKLQEASNVAKALDTSNYRICNALPTRISVCKNDAECQKVIIDYYNDLAIENQFIIFVESNNPKAVDLWLERYCKRVLDYDVRGGGYTTYGTIPSRADVGISGGSVTVPSRADARGGERRFVYILKDNVKAQPIDTFLK